MQLPHPFKHVVATGLCAVAPAVMAHEESGWASIHWHASDFLGLATVGLLTAAVLWLARRSKRVART